MHFRSISSMIFLSLSVMIPASLMWDRVGNLFFTFQYPSSFPVPSWFLILPAHRSAWASVSWPPPGTWQLSSSSVVLYTTYSFTSTTGTIVLTHLSSCPSRQVEMKRQQESGQGMDLYWSHHLHRGMWEEISLSEELLPDMKQLHNLSHFCHLAV